jgi:hypothetical protein
MVIQLAPPKDLDQTTGSDQKMGRDVRHAKSAQS